jgi:hypothetical protein
LAWSRFAGITHRPFEVVDLTPSELISRIRVAVHMGEPKIWLLLGALAFGACGLAYDASTHARAIHMLHSLKAGESSLEVHQNWGEPDLREYVGHDEQIWSYAVQPNSNDVAATLLYTSVKPGDTGSFLDLKFINGKLVSWNKAERTVPAKQGAGFSFGVGPVGGVSNVAHF